MNIDAEQTENPRIYEATLDDWEDFWYNEDK
jgi:hypothetical protein